MATLTLPVSRRRSRAAGSKMEYLAIQRSVAATTSSRRLRSTANYVRDALLPLSCATDAPQVAECARALQTPASSWTFGAPRAKTPSTSCITITVRACFRLLMSCSGDVLHSEQRDEG